jgi:putative FmdB family regulatory protein
MPLFDYKCKDCGTISEILVNSPDDRIIHCSVCNSSSMDKLFSASYLIKMDKSMPGAPCCGRQERCDTHPCSSENNCQRR